MGEIRLDRVSFGLNFGVLRVQQCLAFMDPRDLDTGYTFFSFFIGAVSRPKDDGWRELSFSLSSLGRFAAPVVLYGQILFCKLSPRICTPGQNLDVPNEQSSENFLQFWKGCLVS